MHLSRISCWDSADLMHIIFQFDDLSSVRASVGSTSARELILIEVFLLETG